MMYRLRQRELGLFSKALLKLYESHEPELIHERLVECVSTLTKGVYIACEVVDPTNNVYQSTSSVRMPNHEAWLKRVGELVHQNPVVPFVMQGGSEEVLSPLDLMSRREFERTDLYNEAFRLVGGEQIVTLIPNQGSVMGVTVNRKEKFREYDRSLLKMVRPHLMKAYEGAQFILRLKNIGVSVAEPQKVVRRGLTVREVEVLHWMREGKTDREIGLILGISHRTVNLHVATILKKLGVESRTAAVIMTFGSD